MLFRLLETYGWLGTIIWDWCTRFWGWVTDDASGFFTMLLTGIAVFQLGLFYRQLSFMRASLAEAKSATIGATEAAKAANLNAQAVINAERAHLWPGFPTCSPQPDGNSVLWHISLLNTGRTPGIVKSIHYALSMEPDFNMGLLTLSEYDGNHDVVLPNVPAPNGSVALASLSSENQRFLAAMSCIATYSGISTSRDGSIAFITTVPGPTHFRDVTATLLNSSQITLRV